VSAAIDELFAILESIGATVTLYGKPVTKNELESYALVSAIERLTAPSWTFTIPKKLATANRYIVNSGSGRFAYKKARDEWTWWLITKRNEVGIPKATGKRHVSIDRLFSGRERLFDPDNLAASTKSLLDAMVLAGLLVDDSAAFVECDWSQSREAESGVRVTITEAA
jgi:hypothetical protein